MRLRIEVACWLLAAGCGALEAAAPGRIFYQVQGVEAGSWGAVLSSLGLQPAAAGATADVVVLRPGGKGVDAAALAAAGAFVIAEGECEAVGFRAGAERVRVVSVEDLRRPELRIVWEHAAELPVFTLPADARIFMRERWGKAPLMAGVRRGEGAVLWVATDPGARGYERYPYLMHALADLGFTPPFTARRLWAFFDSSYRARADLDYLARRWRRSGVAALHVAAWHFFERDPQRDEYLERLVRVCHRNSILVYAWLELPHVSEQFWLAHPEWREKTGVLQDAHLDWRKLMNLTNRECFRAAAGGIESLIARFDWDGVNLAELYFESLEGAANPSRFTPMNDDVRAEFKTLEGFDPVELFAKKETHGTRGLRAFLGYRAALASRMQAEWIAEMETVRRGKPHLDMVLTHVDDRFDTGMRDAIGADAARVLPLLGEHEFTFMIEDPATVWHLGPQRYPEIAKRYRPLTPRSDKLAIDINIVERYQDVYPTKQQTGTELFQQLALASQAFPRVMLYFENSILAPDVPLLGAATAAVNRAERIGPRLAIDSSYGAGVPWVGPVKVNGRPWPATDGTTAWLPPGVQTVEGGERDPAVRLLDFNGELKSAAAARSGIQFTYRTFSRAIAVLDRKPVKETIDTVERPVEFIEAAGPYVVALPRGQHLAEIECE